jgi:radical SAM protein with 4Fe4S-binding SPASM domain
MTIKTQEYKDFSWNLHAKFEYKPIMAQLELTHQCPLHCKHCFSGCYNNKAYASKELSTNQVKIILNKCKYGGVIWLCFTGGDPMMRKDFNELYLYAKKLGFITTVFSPLVSMDKKTLGILRSSPPFNIETTLNAATSEKYKEITGTDLFKNHVQNIKELLRNNIPVKVKSQITKQNISQIEEIEKLVESFGLNFRPANILHARINGDTYPCTLRLDPEEVIFVKKRYLHFYERGCRQPGKKINIDKLIQKPVNKKLLPCRAGCHSFWITPQGKMIVCGCLRIFNYDLSRKNHTVKSGFYKFTKIHSLNFKTESKCGLCEYRTICNWCPGIALLETKSLEEPIDYFCNVTKEDIKAHRS